MKLTVIESDLRKAGCKHEVGKVYKYLNSFHYLVTVDNKYHFVYFNGDFVGATIYDTLEQVDMRNPNDVEVDAEIIIHEVKE